MTELVQNLVDGLGRGSIYALLALGIAVIFGVMHLLNFAHGELITVSGYVAYWAFTNDASWYWVAPGSDGERRRGAGSARCPDRSSPQRTH